MSVRKNKATRDFDQSEDLKNTSDIKDNQRDNERLKQDKASLDLPDATDIPGQENVLAPPLGELADTTISSDDEEGDDLFEENENEKS